MRSATIVSPENQSVTFVELFFDLVFVFSVTQVVSLLHHGFDLISIGQATLVFYLVWWAWTQFTWTLNAANTENRWVALGTLLATAVAFFMAIGVPDAFHGRALWFALPYVAVRGIGLALQYWVALSNAAQRAAVRTFALVSIGGLIAVVIGGIVGEGLQHWFWMLAIIIDVVATIIGAQSENWNLHWEHFVERHGLFVIIALGETLIVAAGAVSGVTLTGDLIVISILAVAITCGLWWSYFMQAKPALDDALAAHSGSEQAQMARDVFSLMHFPMLCGVVGYAVAIEAIVAHPDQALVLDGRIALAAGIVLFAISDVTPATTLAIVFVGICAVIFFERGGDVTLELEE